MQRENPFVPIYRACNNGDNRDKYQRIRNGELTVPRYIDVELTNMCNFRCCFCPTGTKSMHRMKGYMSDEVVDAIAYNVEKYNIPGVRFIRWGEPTMHPKYIEIIGRMKKAGALTHINTNGSLLDKDQITHLLDAGLDSIKFSFQGADEGTYAEMREGGGDYSKLLNNIRLLHDLRGDNPYPYIQVSTTLTGETVEQIENFKSDVQDICDYYNIGYTKLNHLNVDNMQIDEAEKEKIRALQKNETLHHTYTEVCPEAFDKLSINWNGDVTLCCSDYDNFMLVGNILDNDLQEIFTSHAADNYRKVVADHQYGKIQCCRYCYNVIPLNK